MYLIEALGLINCGFCMWEFAYSLEFVCNPQLVLSGTFVVICGHVHSSKKISHHHTFPAEVKQGKVPVSALLL